MNESDAEALYPCDNGFDRLARVGKKQMVKRYTKLSRSLGSPKT